MSLTPDAAIIPRRTVKRTNALESIHSGNRDVPVNHRLRIQCCCTVEPNLPGCLTILYYYCCMCVILQCKIICSTVANSSGTFMVKCAQKFDKPRIDRITLTFVKVPATKLLIGHANPLYGNIRKAFQSPLMHWKIGCIQCIDLITNKSVNQHKTWGRSKRVIWRQRIKQWCFVLGSRTQAPATVLYVSGILPLAETVLNVFLTKTCMPRWVFDVRLKHSTKN